MGLRVFDEQSNYVLFGDDSRIFLYENLGDSLRRFNSLEDSSELTRILSRVEIPVKKEVNLPEIRTLLREGPIGQLVLDIANDCNMRCDYCIYSDLYPNERKFQKALFMEEDILRKALHFYLNRAGAEPKITFYGGEPLINFPMIEKAVSVCRELTSRDVSFSVATNGVLLKNQALDFLMENDFFLLVSLDGPKEVNDRFRCFPDGSGTYDIITHNLERIRELDMQYYESNVSFNITLPDLDKTLEVFGFFESEEILSRNKCFPHRLVPTIALPSSLGWHGQSDELIEGYVQCVQSGKTVSEPLKGEFEPLLKWFRKRQNDRLSGATWPGGMCVPGLKKLYVDPKGEFFMCEGYNSHQAIGNVDEGLDVEKILRLVSTFTSIKNKLCSSCWAERLCYSCMASAKDGLNNEISVGGLSSFCPILKDNILKTLYIEGRLTTH